jgi:predicted dehydrogenase
VVSRTQAKAQQFADKYGIKVALAGYDADFQSAPVDVFYVATPNEFHSEHCLHLLTMGKSVLCEKPFALNAAEGERVVKAARTLGLFCMEAMWMRFAPAVRAALESVREGKIGKISFLSAQLGFPYKEDDGKSRLFRKPGGGALLDLGVYPLSLAHAFLGKPVRVKSSFELASSGVDAQFAALLEYPGGAQAMIAASLNAQLLNFGSLHGETGTLRLGQPLYFPETYKLLQTPPHNLNLPRRGFLAKARRLSFVRRVADLHKRSQIRHIDLRSSRNGYSLEAEEVQRCLRAGLRESPEMTCDDTISILESMDRIRTDWLIDSSR